MFLKLRRSFVAEQHKIYHVLLKCLISTEQLGSTRLRWEAPWEGSVGHGLVDNEN